MSDRNRLLLLALAVAVGGGTGYVCRPASKPKTPDARPAHPTPAPTPLPSPTPERRVAKLLIVVSTNCVHCDRLKADWRAGFGVPHEYVMVDQALLTRWRIEGTPTLLALDASGREIDRQLGYGDREELSAWLSGMRERAPFERVFGAPAPLPRRNAPALPVECVASWGEHAKYRTWFFAGGNYAAEDEKVRWSGRWSLDAKERKLIVVERRLEGAEWGDPVTYVFLLEPCLRRGKFEASGMNFRIEAAP